ncbi:MAG TPA: helix-turn-helix domain-containing protein [Longimicrobiales bacterium]|jgi:putative transcriptional regulator
MSHADESFGDLLLQGAREALAHKRGELDARVTRRKVTARAIDIVPPPPYGQREIRALRDRLELSQAAFAELLAVSRASVRAWEQGTREPSGPVRRLMEILERGPEAVAVGIRAVG